jgi:hypothetical protein
VKVLFRSPFPLPAFWFLLGLILALFVSTLIPSHANESRNQPQSSQANAATAEPLDAPWIKPDSTLYKSIKYAGKFHLMVLHFPIAFLLAGALVQWSEVIRKKGGSAVPILLWFGAIAAVATATLGWMYAYDSVYFGDDANLLFWHRWLGTSTAAVALIVLSLRKKLGPKSLAVALTLCAGLVATAAHFGASLSYGSNFLLKF